MEPAEIGTTFGAYVISLSIGNACSSLWSPDALSIQLVRCFEEGTLDAWGPIQFRQGSRCLKMEPWCCVMPGDEWVSGWLDLTLEDIQQGKYYSLEARVCSWCMCCFYLC